MSLLSARDLSVAPPAEGSSPPPEPVVRGFSLELERGEWVALSGANGCGKTTLLLVLAGLWPARSGQVLLAGESLGRGSPPRFRSRIATILQDPSCQLLQPSVREELSFAALNLGRPPGQVALDTVGWSARLGLAGDLDRDPQRLSAGRQQLVLLAAALIARPDVLLADEPAAHLDPVTRKRVLDLVRDEVRRGLSVLWVTQHEEERGAADRVVDLTPACGPGAPWPPSPPSPGPPLLTLRIAPARGEDGPRVEVRSEVVIPVSRIGLTAIGGRNGAGKSVLLAAAAGLQRLDQVAVAPGSTPDPPPILAGQYPELEIFEEKAIDEVVYAAVSRGVARETAVRDARAALRRLGLDPSAFLARRTWSLSGGEKRLLSLASALIAPASLLALDEPTAGLDPSRRAALAGLVAESARSRAVLVACQDRDWLSGLVMQAFQLDESAGS